MVTVTFAAVALSMGILYTNTGDASTRKNRFLQNIFVLCFVQKTKRCKKCRKAKPLSEFYMTTSNGKQYPRSRCKPCLNTWSLAAFKRHPEYQQRIAVNRKKKRASIPFDYYRAQVLGWSLEKAWSVYNAQDGRCAICGRPPGKNRLSLDHNHKTGVPRQFLCAPCNAAVAVVESASRLEELKAYLEKHELIKSVCQRPVKASNRRRELLLPQNVETFPKASCAGPAKACPR